MVLLADYAANVSPWPCMGFPLGLNSLVHVFLYAYYAKVAHGGPLSPTYKKALTQVCVFNYYWIELARVL